MFVTITFTGPAGPGGVVTVICVALLREMFVPSFGPNFTDMPVRKFAPAIVTDVPPATGPATGLTVAIVGALK
jgi:hypothetical protein